VIAAQIGYLLARQYTRNGLLITLFILVPLLFITLSYYTTAPKDLDLFVSEGGTRTVVTEPMPQVHGAIMVPITAAFLAGMAGLFAMVEARNADSRLVIAGLSPATVALGRLGLISAMAVIVALISVAIDLVSFQPENLPGFVLANILVGVTFGFLGALMLLLAGRLGGAYLMLLIPMIDVGVFQDPMMISGAQAPWMKLLPGFGGTRFALDAAFSTSADDWPALAAALTWPLLSGVLMLWVFASKART
jgi:hypothetical protein